MFKFLQHNKKVSEVATSTPVDVDPGEAAAAALVIADRAIARFNLGTSCEAIGLRSE